MFIAWSYECASAWLLNCHNLLQMQLMIEMMMTQLVTINKLVSKTSLKQAHRTEVEGMTGEVEKEIGRGI